MVMLLFLLCLVLGRPEEVEWCSLGGKEVVITESIKLGGNEHSLLNFGSE